MPESLDSRCHALLVDLELIEPGDFSNVSPLTGGVSSEIAKVKVGIDEYCAKFALEKLKVAAEWQAPVHRNASEYKWLKYVSGICEANVPKLYGRSQTLNGFAMEFVSGDDVRLWKTDLFVNGVNLRDIEAVARVLGTIHHASAQSNFDRSGFENMDDFFALRLDPYFGSLVEKHSNLSKKIGRLISVQQATQSVLIHGDVSPKNILFKDEVPIFLDAECATMGDPVFDVGFCMNHLLLKAVHMPQRAKYFTAAAKHFWENYQPFINWETSADLQGRLIETLPAFLLARVDGKSPVEYLSEDARRKVRSFAISNIEISPVSLDNLLDDLREAI